MKKSAWLMGAAAPLALAWTAPALAQDENATTAAPAAADDGARADEIIVMARKREESVLKVPVIETVLTAKDLDRQQVTTLTDITEQVAGLQVGGNVLSVGTQISLRGVGTSSLDAGVDQSVSLNIDGLQLTQGSSYSVGIFDVAQVEVLKGPQALFFGKNSPGGVIAIRTADPGDELEVIARAIYGFEAREKRGELIVSAPLSDTFGVRVAAALTDDDGYFKNRATALPGTGAVTPRSGRYNATEEYILRGTVLWEPTDTFSARLKVNNTVREITGGGAPLGSCPDGIGAPAGIQFINPNETCKVDRTLYIVDLDPSAFAEVRNGGVPFLKFKTTFGTLELNYDVNDAIALTSTTGYYNNRFDGSLNGVNSGFAGPTLIADNRFKRRDLTQELRLDTDFDGPLNFLVGGYYQDARVRNRVFVAGNALLFGLPAFTPFTLVSGVNDVKIEAKSVFGQLRWRPIEVIEIAAGARYTDEKRVDRTFSATSFFSPLTPITVPNPRLRSKNWSPEVTITYTPTDDFTLFAAVKQGYKSGSFILTLPPTQGVDNSFDDERVRGGEVGMKARLLDRALNLNLAAYYYKYSDLQVGANEVAQGGLPVIRTINAASSKVYGVDFEASYRPPALEGLTARLAVNWNRARFTSFPNAPCSGGQTIAEGCNQVPIPLAPGTIVTPTTRLFAGQDLSGLPLPRAADWAATGGFDYETLLSNFKLRFGANGQYSSKFLKNLGRRADFYQPSFFKLNANVGIGAENDSWQVDLIANNLTNKFTAGNCTQFSAATGQIFAPPLTGAATRNASGVDELACIPDKGREVFLRLTLRPTSFGL